MHYTIPRMLRPRNKVAIVAPSSPFKSDEVQAGIDIIREAGLEPVLGPCVKYLRSSSDKSAPLAERVSELNWALTDPGVHGVIAATGGHSSAALLPYLDYAKIRAARKPFLGMSDHTAINCGLLSHAELISFNGQTPSIRLDKGKKKYEADCESFRFTLEMMMSNEKWFDKPFRFNPYFPRTVTSGEAEGHVVGGNLDTFVHLIGTPYLPEVDGAILFIEDVHKTGLVLDREMLHLRLAGILDRISGVVIGEFAEVPNTDDVRTPAPEDVVIEYFANGVPCVYGYSFSHGDYTSPIPIGAMCRINADTGIVSFDDFSMRP